MIKDILLLTVFPAGMALAAANDLITMTVPNRLAIALALSFFVLAPLAGLTLTAIGLHLAIGFAAFALGFALFAAGWIGGGDAKLFAATALWLGPEAVVSYGLTASLFGGALALLMLSWRRLPLPAFLMGQSWILRLHDAREGIPYGIALAAGGLIAYLDTPFMAALGS